MKFFSKNFQQTTVSGQASDSIASKRKEQFVGAAILEGNYFQGVHQHLVAASRCKGNSVLRHRAWKFQGTRLLVRFEAPWPAFDARTYTMHVSQQGFCKANGKRKERFIFKVQKYKRIWFILNEQVINISRDNSQIQFSNLHTRFFSSEWNVQSLRFTPDGCVT